MAEDRKRNTKFYTNKDGVGLYERFNQTLKHAQYFDSLVGYFGTSGFYRLYKSLEKAEKIGEKSYDYIFIDEAHRFRNGKNTQHDLLKKVCRNKKLFLLVQHL